MKQTNQNLSMEALSSQTMPYQELLAQGWNFLRNKQINDAINISQHLNKSHPDNGDGWYYTAQVAVTIGNLKAAKQSFKNACKLVPAQIAWKISLANTYYNLREIEQVKSSLNDLESLALTATQHNQIALLFSQIHLYEQSIKHYQEAISLEPNNHSHYYSLAAVYRYAGNLEQAEAYLTKAIEYNAHDIDAHALRVDVKKQTPRHNHIESLTALLEQNGTAKQLTSTQLPATQLTTKDKVQINFALAKSYEDLGDSAKSFEYLQQGARLRRQHIEYNIKQDQTIMAGISKHFDQSWWSNTPIAKQEKLSEKKLTPIFIIGMPRTGSTLIDRVLSTGKTVLNAGELNDFSRLLTEQVQQKFGAEIKNKQQFIKAASQIDFEKLGNDYLASVKDQFAHLGLGESINYFSDKLPFNFLYTGLIQKALPHAKIIHVTRDPMDTCYAVFKTLFQQAYPFSYEQKELAEYFIAYKKLMTHWQQLTDRAELNIHTVSYEQLVSEPAKISEQLYQFCGLTWQAEYADMQNNNAAVTTASASQVRQPIHKDSVQKWRKYEQQLLTLKQRLERAGILCD